MKKVCQVLEIKSQCLIKPKQIQRFDGKAAKPITYAIYLTLTIDTHTKSLALLLITKLGNHSIILDQLWIKKHGVIIDMTNNSLTFWPGHCTYVRVSPLTILSQPTFPTKTAVVVIEKNITLQKIINKGSMEDKTDVLQVPYKLSNKKRRQINKNKWKAGIRETSPRKAIISNLSGLDKDPLSVSIPTIKELLSKTQNINIAMIGADIYHAACRLKKA